MPIQYVNPETEEFNLDAIKDSGAPSVYGIKTVEDLVSTSIEYVNNYKST